MIVFKIRYCKVISKYIYLDIIKPKYTYLNMTTIYYLEYNHYKFLFISRIFYCFL